MTRIRPSGDLAKPVTSHDKRLTHEGTEMMKDRGFACVALHRPKFPANIGAVLRAASCYGVAQLNIAGCRAADLKHKSNTPMAHRHIPTFMVMDPLEYLPVGCHVVAVDLLSNATPLPSFRHPERAVYVFGGEDETLGADITERADHVVYVPTNGCMNLAACVNVVLYDRMLKGGRFDAAYEGATEEVAAAFYKRRGDAQ